MAEADDEKPRLASDYVIGQPLEALSVVELNERIRQLRQEIARLEAARARKEAAQMSAEAFFKK